jgi:hypothetical protein
VRGWGGMTKSTRARYTLEFKEEAVLIDLEGIHVGDDQTDYAGAH